MKNFKRISISLLFVAFMVFGTVTMANNQHSVLQGDIYLNTNSNINNNSLLVTEDAIYCHHSGISEESDDPMGGAIFSLYPGIAKVDKKDTSKWNEFVEGSPFFMLSDGDYVYYVERVTPDKDEPWNDELHWVKLNKNGKGEKQSTKIKDNSMCFNIIGDNLFYVVRNLNSSNDKEYEFYMADKDGKNKKFITYIYSPYYDIKDGYVYYLDTTDFLKRIVKKSLKDIDKKQTVVGSIFHGKFIQIIEDDLYYLDKDGELYSFELNKKNAKAQKIWTFSDLEGDINPDKLVFMKDAFYYYIESDSAKDIVGYVKKDKDNSWIEVNKYYQNIGTNSVLYDNKIYYGSAGEFGKDCIEHLELEEVSFEDVSKKEKIDGYEIVNIQIDDKDIKLETPAINLDGKIMVPKELIEKINEKNNKEVKTFWESKSNYLIFDYAKDNDDKRNSIIKELFDLEKEIKGLQGINILVINEAYCEEYYDGVMFQNTQYIPIEELESYIFKEIKWEGKTNTLKIY